MVPLRFGRFVAAIFADEKPKISEGTGKSEYHRRRDGPAQIAQIVQIIRWPGRGSDGGLPFEPAIGGARRKTDHANGEELSYGFGSVMKDGVILALASKLVL
jgi:hypothetical protein